MIPKELLKALRQIEIHTARLATDALGGNYTSVFRGQGMVFREARPYQIGDDVRAIDWNVSARTGVPHGKLFTEEREMTVMLAVDVSASQRFGTGRATKARVAAEVAALIAFSAIHNGDRVGLVMMSDQVERIVPPRKGEKHVMRVAREVIAAEPRGTGTDLAVGIEALSRLSKRRSVAFLVSDFFLGEGGDDNGEGWRDGKAAARARVRFERAIAHAAAKHDLIAVELVDPRDDELPDVGLATLEDLESGEEVVVDTSDPRVRAAYKDAARARRQLVRDVFRRLGVDLVIVRTDGADVASVVAPLRDLFARRARRGGRARS